MNTLDPLRELEKELRDEMKLFERHSTGFGAVFNAMTACISRVIERMEKAAPRLTEAEEFSAFEAESRATCTCSLCVAYRAKHASPQPEARYTVTNIFDGEEVVERIHKDGSGEWVAAFANRADAVAFVAMKEGRKP